MEERFKKELESFKKLGFLNPNNLSEAEASILPFRYGTKVIVLNEENKIILIKVINEGYFTLVGGGIENNENIEQGMFRECKEETGYDVTIITNLGYIEFWNKKRKFDFGFLVKTNGEPSALKLTPEEIEFGNELNYYNIDDAIEVVNNEIKLYGNSASVRSLIFLEEAQKYLKNMVK